MNRVLRAVLISAAATGVAALATYAVRRPEDAPHVLPVATPPRQDTVLVEADAFTGEQRDLLMQEFQAQESL